MVKIKFSKILSELMAKQNLTVSELSKKSGIHYVMINRYLKSDRKGKLPSVETILSLAKALECSLDELLGFKISNDNIKESPILSSTARTIGIFIDDLDAKDNLKKLLLLAIKKDKE